MGRIEASPVVVVTGASAGVGRATAVRFARDGARVALLARGEAGLEGARREVEEAGGRALVVPVDVADPGGVEAAAARIEEELGPIDVWINNAMVTVLAEVVRTTPEEFRRVTEVTYLGQVHGTLSALRRMLPRDRGTVVLVGSALAHRSIPLQSAYCGAKHAVRGFFESLRTELIHRGSEVHVTMVQLPALNTPQFGWCRTRMPRRPQPVPPIFQPEVAADAIHFAARHRRRELWVGAPTALAIVGNRVAPALADRYLGRTGYDSQQHDGLVPEDRLDNLFAPVDDARDHGTRGEFDDRANEGSLQLRAAKARPWLALAAAGLAAAMLAGRGAARGRRAAALTRRGRGVRRSPAPGRTAPRRR
ncbi:SDR family oxidoreductase [Myxococcota bacterium]|nr:SDR family oxidoreductase [Myxococcota bacterium]